MGLIQTLCYTFEALRCPISTHYFLVLNVSKSIVPCSCFEEHDILKKEILYHFISMDVMQQSI